MDSIVWNFLLWKTILEISLHNMKKPKNENTNFS